MKLREILTQSAYFVTGIDTDAGKTIATGWLSKMLLDEGIKVVTQKLVQTGCQGISDDILQHRRIEGRDLLEVDKDQTTHPLLFDKPCSPHMAARLDGKTVEISRATQATERLLQQYEMVLIEGAGGLMVPLTDELLTIDYIQEQQHPVILVTTAKLGSINHTLLTLEVLKQRELKTPLVIYNRGVATDPEITEDNWDFLYHRIRQDYPESLIISMPFIDFSV